jgi:hypothetical protein
MTSTPGASDAPPELRRAEVEVHRQRVAEREPAWSAAPRGHILYSLSFWQKATANASKNTVQIPEEWQTTNLKFTGLTQNLGQL